MSTRGCDELRAHFLVLLLHTHIIHAHYYHIAECIERCAHLTLFCNNNFASQHNTHLRNASSMMVSLVSFNKWRQFIKHKPQHSTSLMQRRSYVGVACEAYPLFMSGSEIIKGQLDVESRILLQTSFLPPCFPSPYEVRPRVKHELGTLSPLYVNPTLYVLSCLRDKQQKADPSHSKANGC